MSPFRFNFQSLAVKLNLQLLLIGCSTVGVLFYIVMKEARKTIREDIQVAAMTAVSGAAKELEQTLKVGQQAVNDVSMLVETGIVDENDIDDLILRVLAGLRNKNEAFCGMSVSLVPEQDHDKYPRKMYYVFYDKEGRLQFTMLGGTEYQYQLKNWFLMPRELGESTWVEPYFDAGGGDTYMTTFSQPLYREHEDGSRHFIGVATVDVELAGLQKTIAEINVQSKGDAMLVSQLGTFIAHKDPDLLFNESVFSLADEDEAAGLRTVGREMVRGKAGNSSYYSPRYRNSWVMLCFAPVQSTGWSVVIVFPFGDLYAPLSRLNITFLLTGIAGLIGMVALTVMISHRITRPLLHLSLAAADIGRGNFGVRLPEYRSRDEIGRLTESFDAMRQQLVYYTTELAETTASRQKIESEIAIAQQIQRNLVPRLTGEFVNDERFSIDAFLNPAREVGGDLFDFFFVGENKIAVIVGDVSGKGIPAALFMAMTQITQRSEVDAAHSTGELVSNINRLLYRDNETMMFVTYFIAVIDIETGMIQYTNAGHNQPLLLRAGGEIETIREQHGVPLAITEESYGQHELQLRENDTLFIYTDGVSEAMNVANQEYGLERLTAALRKGMVTGNAIECVCADLGEFVGGNEQSDDITMLVFKLKKFRKG